MWRIGAWANAEKTVQALSDALTQVLEENLLDTIHQREHAQPLLGVLTHNYYYLISLWFHCHGGLMNTALDGMISASTEILQWASSGSVRWDLAEGCRFKIHLDTYAQSVD